MDVIWIYLCVILFFFFFNDTATTEIYTLSLHDALPIYEWWLIIFQRREKDIQVNPVHPAVVVAQRRRVWGERSQREEREVCHRSTYNSKYFNRYQGLLCHCLGYPSKIMSCLDSNFLLKARKEKTTTKFMNSSKLIKMKPPFTIPANCAFTV